MTLLLLAGFPATALATVLVGNSTVATAIDMNIPGRAQGFFYLPRP
jgi:hypothetical protein